jgi:hypothetical protein
MFAIGDYVLVTFGGGQSLLSSRKYPGQIIEYLGNNQFNVHLFAGKDRDFIIYFTELELITNEEAMLYMLEQ